MRTPLISASTFAALSTAAIAQTSRLDERLLAPLTHRNPGPFRMGARVSDIAVPT
jgi:hypothetical protein